MSTSEYRPDIDGLRAVAVMAVVLHHLSAPLLPGGYVGVDVFFVISGYLITGIISREIAEDQFSFSKFYERRARRIFPTLFAMMVCTLAVSYQLLLPSDMAATMRGALGTLVFSSNIVFWRSLERGYFDATDAGLNPLLHTWSLSVEEQFYVLFPILLLLCFRYARRFIVAILLFCTVVSLAGAAFLVESKSVAVFFLSPFRAWELLAGSLLALNALPLLRSRALRELTAGAGLLAILVVCFLYNGKTTFPGLTALAPVLGAVAIIHAGTSGRNWVASLLQLRPVVFVGLISYSLYLWHWPIIVLTRYQMGVEPITPYIPALLAISLVVASLSYQFIEQPFRRSHRINRKTIFSTSTVLASVIALMSVYGLIRDGFEERFDSGVLSLDKARTPKIPFVSCDGRPISETCMLGRAESIPTVLLWGDSHMLAWGPALDISLGSQGAKGVFAVSSSCPPLFDIQNSIRSNCPAQNLAVKNYLLANPNIKTVVLAAYWGAYFHEDGPLCATVENQRIKGIEAAGEALASTIKWLRSNGRHVVLVGPVAVYEKNVPLSLAMERATNRTLLRTTTTEQREKNAAFFDVVSAAQNEDKTLFSFLDPIHWLCANECKIVQDGTSLYRDSHHLSLEGAIALEPKLRQHLFEHLDRNSLIESSIPAKFK